MTFEECLTNIIRKFGFEAEESIIFAGMYDYTTEDEYMETYYEFMER